MFNLKPVFCSHFPYVKFEKVKPIKKKIIYKQFDIGDDSIVNDEMLRELVKWNKTLLLDNRVPIGKIRFVFQSSFTYDIDTDTINPKYQVMIPVDENGSFIKDAAIAEINKPTNLIRVNVKSYRNDNNYEYLKSILKYCKRGLVIYIGNDTQYNHFTGKSDPVKFSVDCDIIRFANLDEEVQEHLNQQI